ncbi:MAG TPA: methyltransferase domain-containing protein [Polyangiaceae bacterium]|nr:methyltransferase domain-containing protein [Polyangiaceae bacterium]
MLPLTGVLCPTCRAPLDVAAAEIACVACGQRYPNVAGMPVLLREPDAHVALWRGQLGLLLERGEQTLQALQATANGEGLLEPTRARLLALADAVKDQVADVAALLGPALGGAAAPGKALPRGVVEHIGYLYRDWGWPSAGYRENDAALGELAALLGERRLGRVLVLGAGACGLAYELHRRHGGSETVALDIDPYLLVPAQAVLRGERVRLTEAALGVLEATEVARAWPLEAGAGALEPSAFRCLFADGLHPPFADASFDSVLTPWFIDQVPRDLPELLSEVARVLRPGGLWLNHGPLIFPEQVPFERRYARAELFELATRHGLQPVAHRLASLPYLVSPLTRRGKHEGVLSFLAHKG